MSSMFIKQYDSWKIKGCGLCNDSGRNNVRIYSIERKMTHNKAHVCVIDFYKCKQSVLFQWLTKMDSIVLTPYNTHFSILHLKSLQQTGLQQRFNAEFFLV